MITALFQVLYLIIGLYKWAVILAAVFSILSSFGVLDTRNRLVWTIGDFLYRITEPVLRPIRNLLPSFGGIDISPMILLIILVVLQYTILPKLYAAITLGQVQPLLL
jgi:YggT family protein